MAENQTSENIRNVFMVVSSNVINILAQLLVGFVLPMQLGVTHYAYYRVYVLYAGYAGLVHFGLVNGIYLKYGSYNYDQLPRKTFIGLSKFMYFLQAAVALILSVLLVIMRSEIDINTCIAYIFVIINIPLINIKWFYSSINQFTKRFVGDSYVTYIQNILTFLMVVAVVLFHCENFVYVLIATTAINLICVIGVMAQNREILIGRSRSVNKEAWLLIKSGFFLMLSEFIGIILLGMDSMFVQNLFSVEEFSMYSFAVSLVTAIYALINTVANLIYPYLVRANEEKYAEYYTLMSNALTVLTAMSLCGFYVAKFIVNHWMKTYVNSIPIAAILFGTIIFRSIIMLVCGNYFKVLKMIREYTFNNIFAIVISFVLNVAAYLIFRDFMYIAVASLISFILWYLLTDITFVRKLSMGWKDSMLRYGCITAVLLLYYVTQLLPDLTAFFVYLIGAAVICTIVFRKEVAAIKNKVVRR